jgi:hypothetical protein
MTSLRRKPHHDTSRGGRTKTNLSLESSLASAVPPQVATLQQKEK